MATIEFDATLFRQQFPGQFPDPPHTDALLEVYWNTAICYVSPTSGRYMSDDCRRSIINLVTAHLITLAAATTAGSQAGFIESASIDKISVTVQSFDNKNQLQWFFNQTPYGQQAYAQLHAAAAGGMYLGGRNELGSFRRSGGTFSPPSSIVSTVEDADGCALLLLPPTSINLVAGELSAAIGALMFLTIPAACAAFTVSVTDAGAPTGFVINVYTTLPDTGQRYNVHYWDSDARAANAAATQVAQNISVAGGLPGFVMTGLTTGATVNDPNLLVLSGFESNPDPINVILTFV